MQDPHHAGGSGEASLRGEVPSKGLREERELAKEDSGEAFLGSRTRLDTGPGASGCLECLGNSSKEGSGVARRGSAAGRGGR